MGLKITGETKIFSNEFNGRTTYSTSISRKLENGEYENLYIAVQFRKGQEKAGFINITDGFLTFYKTSTGLQKIKLVVLDYTDVDTTGEFIELHDDSDLPF